MACLVVAGTAACSGSDKDWDQASPENQGYQWRGKGEPTNFGSAYSFCRSTLATEAEGQRLEGGSGPLVTAPGGPTTIPGYTRSAPVSRSDSSSRRQFTDCMESQGWVTNTATPPPAFSVPKL